MADGSKAGSTLPRDVRWIAPSEEGPACGRAPEVCVMAIEEDAIPGELPHVGCVAPAGGAAQVGGARRGNARRCHSSQDKPQRRATSKQEGRQGANESAACIG